MYHQPDQSPWGRVQVCDILCPGVFMVSTASHGGILVEAEMRAVLSGAARKCGYEYRGYLCFEEDAQENIVLRELLDKKLWRLPARVKDPVAFEEAINKSIREYNPDYWRSRQHGLENAKVAPTTRSDHER